MFLKQSSTSIIERSIRNWIDKIVNTLFKWSWRKRLFNSIGISLFILLNFLGFLFALLLWLFRRIFFSLIFTLLFLFFSLLYFLCQFLSFFLWLRDYSLTLSINFKHFCFNLNSLSNLIDSSVYNVNKGFKRVFIEWMDFW